MKIRGRTIRTLEGLLISLLLHLLIFLLFFVSFRDLKLPPPPPKSKKISLNLKQIKMVPSTPPAPKPLAAPQPKLQPVQPPKPVTPPKPSSVKIKPIEKKPVKPPMPVAKKKLLYKKARLTVEKKEHEENNVTKATKKKIVKQEEKKKPEKVVKTKPKNPKTQKPKRKIVKKTTPKKPKKTVSHRSGLAGALMGSGSSVSLAPNRSASANYGSQTIKQLYGSEFDSFTPAQKKFIKKNLGIIHRITQRTLIQNGYPDVAVRTRQEGTNVVTFYLHPNGNITGLRLQSRIGYTALDENTLEVIRIAYKEYPRPKTKTKITFYVQYSIY